MADQNLQGLRVAAVVADDFEQVELTEPMKALQQAGAQVTIVSPNRDKVRGMHHDEKADTFDVDLPLDQLNPDDFDALLLPGGALNADQLRMMDKAQSLVRRFAAEGKPMAVICHAPWLLVSAGLAKGRTLTSWPTLRDDVNNAGGRWVDREVVVDGNLVTSRGPQDIPAFNREMINLFAKAKQQRRAA